MGADAAHADDEQRLAAEFVLALAEIADHAAPHLLVLIVARFRQSTRHRKDQRDRMLGHGARIDACSTGKPNVLRRQLLPGILVHARTDRLDELQLGGGRNQLVLPHARDHHDIGFAHPLLQIVEVPDLKALHPGLAQVEARLHLVRRVGEANRHVFLRRKHRGTPG
jgi:hypothetical protein